MRRTAGTVVVAALACGLAAAPGFANAVTQSVTVPGTDVASAGIGGMRDRGSGTIQLSGVQGQVRRALLYWHGPTRSADQAVNANPTLNGRRVDGVNVGLASDNCWGYWNSQAYRADVTPIVTGDGSYALAGLANHPANVNGASLVVFFDDGDDANDRDVVLFDGNDSNIPSQYDGAGWDVTLAGIRYDTGTARIALHVADGQIYADQPVSVNGVQMLPASSFQGDSVPNAGTAGSFAGGLWDIRSFDVSSLLRPGENTLRLTHDYSDDCLSLVIAAVNLPTGAAPLKADVSVRDAEVEEGDGDTTELTFTLELDEASELPVTVDFATSDGTAQGGDDYAARTGTVTFAPGTLTRTVSVGVAGDTTVEPDETLELTLSGPLNARLADAVATGTILNDDRHPTALKASPAIAEVLPGARVVLRPLAQLTRVEGALPLAGREVVFRTPAGEPICSATTDGDGTASCDSIESTVGAALGYRAAFAGTDEHLPSKASGPIVTVDGTPIG